MLRGGCRRIISRASFASHHVLKKAASNAFPIQTFPHPTAQEYIRHASQWSMFRLLDERFTKSPEPSSPFPRSDGYEDRQLVITASGPDRPGLVSRLSKLVLDCGGNVEESRMARLAGDFSVIMLLSMHDITPKRAEAMRQKLMEFEGLQVNTRWTMDERISERGPTRKFRRISLKGADNPGLVYNVTEYLASNHINIENLETTTEEAPFGGTTLFTLDGVVAMPLQMSTRELQQHLDTLQSTLGVQITLDNLDPKERAKDMRDWSRKVATDGKSRYSIA